MKKGDQPQSDIKKTIYLNRHKIGEVHRIDGKWICDEEFSDRLWNSHSEHLLFVSPARVETSIQNWVLLSFPIAMVVALASWLPFIDDAFKYFGPFVHLSLFLLLQLYGRFRFEPI